MFVSVTFSKSAALLCAGLFCQPALYGGSTPEGTFTTQRVFNRKTQRSSIMFTKRGELPLTIHRTWLGNPSQRRPQRLASTTPNDNKITGGCINVSDEMFNRLWQLPDGTQFTIHGPSGLQRVQPVGVTTKAALLALRGHQFRQNT